MEGVSRAPLADRTLDDRYPRRNSHGVGCIRRECPRESSRNPVSLCGICRRDWAHRWLDCLWRVPMEPATLVSACDTQHDSHRWNALATAPNTRKQTAHWGE